MIDDGPELELALFGTSLEGRTIRSVQLPDRAGSVLLVDCDGGEAQAAWKAARSVLDTTGRWPVVTCAFGVEIDSQFARRSTLSFDGASAREIVEEIDRRSNADAVDVFTRHVRSSDVFEPRYGSISHVQYSLDELQRTAGRSPTESEVRAAIGSTATAPEFERFLIDWEDANGIVSKVYGGHMGWFDLEPDDGPMAIVFLPTPRQCESVAHLSFYGANGKLAALGGVLRSWSERFGAELVANYGTMLQFVVERPPSEIDTAFDLACEHQALASRTLEGVSLRDHARSLVGQETWFLHERP